MKKRLLTFAVTLLTGLSMVAVMIGGLGRAPAAHADNVYQTLPFSQNWNQTNLITSDDNWSGVPGILGYTGQDTTHNDTGLDPQWLLAPTFPGNSIQVRANQTNPNTLLDAAVAEFHLPNPVVGIRAQGDYDHPHLVIHINTTGHQNINVAYVLRDLYEGGFNAQTQVALHYRVGETGNFTNVPEAYVADATSAPGATLITPVSVILPAAVNNQPMVQLRIMTSNAPGSDEWVGIDDIVITGEATGATPVTPPVTPVTPTPVTPTPVTPTPVTPTPVTPTVPPPTEVPGGTLFLYLPLLMR
jgi:uncharacterized protein